MYNLNFTNSTVGNITADNSVDSDSMEQVVFTVLSYILILCIAGGLYLCYRKAHDTMEELGRGDIALLPVNDDIVAVDIEQFFPMVNNRAFENSRCRG